MISPTRVAKKVLLGTMIGDASIDSMNGGVARLILKHSYDQVDYLVWKMQLLFPLVGDFYIYLYEKERAIQATTKGSKYIKHIFDDFYLYNNEGRKQKIVDISVLRRFSKISLACWYGDDGCLRRRPSIGMFGLNFATGSFSDKDHLNMVQYFQENWKLKTQYGFWDKDHKWLYLRMAKYESMNFIDMIKKYLPECLKYKIDAGIYKSAGHVKKSHEDIVRTLQECGELIRNNQSDSKCKYNPINWTEYIHGDKSDCMELELSNNN